MSRRRGWCGLAALALLAACAVANSGHPDSDGGAEPTVDAMPGVEPDARPRPDAAPPTPDAGLPCPTEPCDLVDQCGCSSPDVCDIDLDNLPATGCRSVSSPGKEMAECVVLSDCAGGYVCIGDETGASCKRYCRDSGDCDAPRGQCVITINSGGVPIPGAVVCTSNCDPTNTAGGGCPLGWGCYPYQVNPDMTPDTGDEFGIADCARAGAGTQGATCTVYGDCAPDYLCIGTCAHNCVVGGPAVCPGATLCTAFATPFSIQGVEYGYCA